MEPTTNYFVVALQANLGCDNKPIVPSPAKVGSQQKNFNITKPQLLLESKGSEAMMSPVD